MRVQRYRATACSILFALISAWPAEAGRALDYNPHCAAPPRTAWLSSAEISDRLREVGYELMRVRLDDRCYKLMVRDGIGQIRDLVVHPVTFEIMR
ncbi:MAG: PepSY domain-containing protein [Hyphomicrobiales bacterium]|uniref:PepSY domain-containing protein n=1 Tax=Rhabdaerophilum calidifontis TaxID=2604328 RepID=UPI001407D315|nr:PepSY domain-containing protein [Rhabdaerophilum calidifontis]MCA1952448.1 PepSY domain-containing protein [Hyphomicrobiales bacterium]